MNNPYDEPTKYWALDGRGRAIANLLHGRRPSAPYPTVPKTDGLVSAPTDAETELHNRINAMRKRVKSWRQADYPGIGGRVLRLLKYWNRKDQYGTRPYFCQVEAIETLVWLCDADASVDPSLLKLRAKLAKACGDHNGAIMRYATKMATGTGKTMVMGMVIAWQALRERSRTDVLILVPNLTVKDRLAQLLPQNSNNVYGKILPRDMQLPTQTRVSIINYQAFQQRLGLDVLPGEVADSKTRRILTAGHPEPDDWKESPQAMLDRVLRNHRGARKIVVINDEAHHCYRPEPKARSDASTGANPREAARWFSTLQHLHDADLLDVVFDMSATPMFISRRADTDTELFPWIVSDYPLIEAIEAGLTKIPRVPVSYADQIKTNNEIKKNDRYRNLFHSIKKDERDLRHDSMHHDVKELLQKLEGKYKIESKRYKKNCKIPVMIVVAYPIQNAKAIYKHLAGYRDGEQWIPGYDMFSNILDGKPVSPPNTLLVTSDMDNVEDKDWKDLAIEQETFFRPGSKKQDRINYLREVFQTVGQKGKPGEKIRCIVSVNMLTEGWDARTVTHVFGYRAFKSDLLCEQVAGRALRRSYLPAGDLEQGELLPPEYAGIFGIPFSFMPGSGTIPASPNSSWKVQTVEDRSYLRVRFPNIRSYHIDQKFMAVELDPTKVAPYKPKTYDPDTVVAGVTGESESLDTMRAHTAIYKLAENITQVYNESGNCTREFFMSVLQVVRAWLKHDNVECDDPRVLVHSTNLGNATKAVWSATVVKNLVPQVLPVFADEHDPTALRELDTGEVDFDTTKIHKYPADRLPAKSELSAAACDSTQETRLAAILDAHDGIEAWARNHRLGWEIPYIDPKIGGWRSYTPDFVARVKGGKAHLVIEFKGQETEDAQIKKDAVETRWIPAVNNSTDPVCAGRWFYVYLDDESRMGSDFDDAVGGALD